MRRAAWPGVVTVIAVVVRVVAAVVLLIGPWTDEPAELAGWDAERFQAIVDDDRRPWAEHPVEYPPGSVLVLEVVAADDVVGTNRALIAISLLVDLAVAAALAAAVDRPTARRYLLLGLPLVPMGYLRLDTLVTALAVAAALALAGGRQPTADPAPTATDRPAGPGRAGATPVRTAAFAVLVAAGTMVKVWPALLVPAALGARRWVAATAAVATTMAVALGWLVWTGAGLDPVDQVASLRGTTGWHVESLPGTVLALLGGEPRFELDAYRIGTVDRPLVLAGRILAVASTVALVALAARHRRGADDADDDLDRMSLVVLGSTSALLVTSPLLSPQFVLWLVPWAALVGRRWPMPGATRPRLVHPVALTAAAALLTGGTLAAVGPPNVADPLPATLLLVRNLVLVAIPVSCGRRLATRQGAPSRPRRPGTPVVSPALRTRSARSGSAGR